MEIRRRAPVGSTPSTSADAAEGPASVPAAPTGPVLGISSEGGRFVQVRDPTGGKSTFASLDIHGSPSGG